MRVSSIARFVSRLPRWLAVGLIVSAGCSTLVVDGQLTSAVRSSGRIATMEDFETARGMAEANVGRLERLHALAPDNVDGLFLLTRAWTIEAFLFIGDEYETAVADGNAAGNERQRKRMREAAARAERYGDELLTFMGSDLPKALKSKTTMAAWLDEHAFHPAAAEALFWAGYCRVGLVTSGIDAPANVPDLGVGVALIEHSAKLDETAHHASAHVVLGQYYAKARAAAPAERHLARAVEITQSRFLPAKLAEAEWRFCDRRDRARYVASLRELVDAWDPLPDARLWNIIAQRRALRLLDGPPSRAFCVR